VLTDDVIEIVQDIDEALVTDLAEDSEGHHVTLIGRVETTFAPDAGSSVELGFDSSKLHFFDLDNGAVIR